MPVNQQNALWLTWRGVEGDEGIWGAYHGPGEGPADDPGPTPPYWRKAQRLGKGKFNSTHGPALAVRGGDYAAQMVWKGSGNDRRIWAAEVGAQAPHVLQSRSGPFLTTGRPAMAVTASERVLLWRNAADDGLVWSLERSGGAWTDLQYTGAQTSHGPALAVLGDTVYAVWKALGDEQIWWSEFRDDQWSPVGPLVATAGAALTSDVPALAVTKRGLVMAWKGVQADPRIWWSEYRYGDWSAPQHVQPPEGAALTSHGPALAVRGNLWSLAWKGSGADQRIWYSERWEGAQWSSPGILDPGWNSFASPALASVSVTFL